MAPTPVFLPGEFSGQRSLAGCSPWGHRELDTTERLSLTPIISWKIAGEKVEAVTYFIFLVSKITVDGDCSHEIERCLLFGRKATTKLDSILKSRDTTLLTKVHIVAMFFFPVVMYGCESWTIKKAEC